MSFLEMWQKVQAMFIANGVDVIDMAYNKYGFMITAKTEGKTFRLTMDEVEKDA